MKVKKALNYIIIFALSTLFLYIFSLWTSPFYDKWYGCDASFFTMAGRAMLRGYVPYRDFFDLKGPYFFFIQELGQFICTGKTGAFIVQVFALFFSICFIIKICRLFVSVKKTAFITVLFLIFHTATLWGGNTLEEYMLPLSLACIYFVLDDLLNKSSISTFSAMLCGISFGVILFSKITVASPIIGLVLAIIIYYIYKKRFKDLFIYLIYAFIGVLIAVTPVILYFYAKGNLKEMLYAVFLFAFNRSVDSFGKFDITWELKISGCYFALLFSVFQLFRFGKYKKNMAVRYTEVIDFILIATTCISVITAVALHFGDPFIYYFTTVYPLIVICFISMFLIYNPFTLFKTWRLDIPIFLLMITMCYFASHTAETLNTVLNDRDTTYHEDYYKAAKDTESLIPLSDRSSVYSINMDMQWFEITNLLPCYSYTINLQFFIDLDPRIETNIINRLNTYPPKWIVVGDDLAGYVPNINKVVCEKYEIIYTNDFSSLYLLKQ